MTFEGVYQTGTVPTYNGASGLLETLLTLVLGTEVTGEVIATAANVNTTLASSPVAKGRLTVDYTISAVAYEGSDDGNGNITGTNITVGTINYSTGKIDITFSGTPTGNVTADYIHGQPGADWKQEFKRNTTDGSSPAGEPFGSDCKEVILSSKGISGQELVLIGIREWEYVAGNAYGWDMNGYTWFNTDMEWNASKVDHGYDDYNDTWEHWTQLPMMPMLDDTMEYWMFSNRQRIVVVIKNSTQYDQCYMGFGRRFGNPSDYHYPLVIAASLYGNYNYADRPAGYRGIHHSYSGASHGYGKIAVGPGEIWSGGGGSSTYAEKRLYFLPRTGWQEGDGVIAPTVGGRLFMSPVYIGKKYHSQAMMDLDGVHSVIGVGILPEDTIRKGQIRSIIFPNVYMTDHFDPVAIEYEAITTTTTTTTTTS